MMVDARPINTTHTGTVGTPICQHPVTSQDYVYIDCREG